jgi:hypothetical protein
MAHIFAETPEATAAAIARTGVASAQTDEARAKPFDQLTLVQKLNRFREKFVAQSEKEIIFNPNHILSGLQSNVTIWDTLPYAADTNYHKRIVIFSQLVGWAQRNAAEPVRQDIRQGTWDLTRENERRTRQSRFNTFDSNYSVVKNSLVDVSISGVVDGVGYKFAAGYRARSCPGWLASDLHGDIRMALAHSVFKTYVEQKQQAYRTYYAASAFNSQLLIQ